MPFIRYTYEPDVREFGDKPILVEDVEARVLCDDKRRAVRVDAPAQFEELTKPVLVEMAEQVGAEVPKRSPKGQFVKALAGADEK